MCPLDNLEEPLIPHYSNRNKLPMSLVQAARRRVASMSTTNLVFSILFTPFSISLFAAGYGIAQLERHYYPDRRQRRGAQFFLGVNDVVESTDLSEIKEKIRALKNEMADLNEHENPRMLIVSMRDILHYIENHLERDLFSISDKIYQSRLAELNLFLANIGNSIKRIKYKKNTSEKIDVLEENCHLIEYYAEAFCCRISDGFYSNLLYIISKTHTEESINIPGKFLLNKIYSRRSIEKIDAANTCLSRLKEYEKENRSPVFQSIILRFIFFYPFSFRLIGFENGATLWIILHEIYELLSFIETNLDTFVIFENENPIIEITIKYLQDFIERDKNRGIFYELIMDLEKIIDRLDRFKQREPLLPTYKFSAFLLPYALVQNENKIGSGSYGDVFKAKYYNSVVAVKVAKCDIYTNEDYSDSLKNEAYLLRSIDCPNIVKLLGIMPTSHSFEIVLEYLPYVLTPLLYEEYGIKLSWSNRVVIAYDLAKALKYLHTFVFPIVHRDVKGHNVLVTSNLRAKLADFSSSKFEYLKPCSSKTTRAWAAPETFTHTPYTTKVDIYSYGVVALELIIAAEEHLADFGKPGSQYKPIAQMTDAEKASLFQSPAPEVLKDLVITCTRPDPDERPDMNAIIEKIEDFFKDELPQPPHKAPTLIF